MTSIILALDAMSRNFGPCITVPAALQALASISSLHLLILGQSDIIAPYLIKADRLLQQRLCVIPVEDVIRNDMKPSIAIRASKGTSMRIALELVNNGESQEVVSAGNTGALMGLAKMIIRPLEGIDRPALMAVFPNQKKGKIVVLDLGANTTSSSAMLVQFAVMGSVISEELVGVTMPRVSLLNIGEEDSKGLDSIRESANFLKNKAAINYIGYLEGNDLLTGKTDVLVCDGFVGNVILKTMEGVLRMLLSLLTSPIDQNKRTWWLRLVRYWLQKIIINSLGRFNPDHYNGACLIGLRGIVIKSHGAANQQAFTIAIKQAAQKHISQRISMRLEDIYSRGIDNSTCI